MSPRRVVVSYDQTNTQGVADSVVKYLQRDHDYDVLVVGPGHGRSLADLEDPLDVRFFLELDAVSGQLYHAEGLDRLSCPKLAYFVDSHKKPHFQQQIAADFDRVFFAMWAWGGLFGSKGGWLPVHYDPEWFAPRARVATYDVGFVGSQPLERTRVLQDIARRHDLKLLLETTTGPREKQLTSELYSQCKIVFNRHVANDLNFRVVEALACRRLLLTDAQRNGQYELFQDREHLVYYKDDRDLEGLLLHYLGNAADRERIASAGHDLVSREHRTSDRVRELVAAAEALVDARSSPVTIDTAGPPHLESEPVLVLAGDLERNGCESQRVARLCRALRGRGARVEVLALRAPIDGTIGDRVHVVGGTLLPELQGAPRLRRALENLPLLEAGLDLRQARPAWSLIVVVVPEHTLAARELGAPYVLVLDANDDGSKLVHADLEGAARLLVPSAKVGEACRSAAPGLAPIVQVCAPEDLAAAVLGAMEVGSAHTRKESVQPASARGSEREVSAEPLAAGRRRGRGSGPDVSVCLVCCDRPDVLEVTLETTRASLLASGASVEWLAFDNGSGPDVEAVLRDWGIDFVIRAGVNHGLATALDALHAHAKGRYLLNLEDDWACLGSGHEWLDLAVGILDTQRDVGVVRLRRLNDDQCGHFRRHRLEVALRHHPWSVEPFPHEIVATRELNGCRYYVASAEWANWTHNPALCRREVIDWIGSLASYLPDPRDHRPRPGHPGLEGAIDELWRGGPWKVAKLLEGPFAHIGEEPARVIVP